VRELLNDKRICQLYNEYRKKGIARDKIIMAKTETKDADLSMIVDVLDVALKKIVCELEKEIENKLPSIIAFVLLSQKCQKKI